MTNYFGLDENLILSRLIESRYDASCFKFIRTLFGTPEKAKLETEEYQILSTDKKATTLFKAAQKCISMEKYYGIKPVGIILEILMFEIDTPNQIIEKIFGDVKREEDLYPYVRKFLSEEKLFRNLKVKQTDRSRGKVGIRLADFSLFKGEEAFSAKSIVSVEVKTREEAYKYLRDELFDYASFSENIYLITTPGLLFKTASKAGDYHKLDKYIQDNFLKVGIGVFIFDPNEGKICYGELPMAGHKIDREKLRIALVQLQQLDRAENEDLVSKLRG